MLFVGVLNVYRLSVKSVETKPQSSPLEYGGFYAFLCFQGGCVWTWLGCSHPDTGRYEIYAVAALMGTGGSAMQVTSLSLVANMIGEETGIVTENLKKSSI